MNLASSSGRYYYLGFYNLALGAIFGLLGIDPNVTGLLISGAFILLLGAITERFEK